MSITQGQQSKLWTHIQTQQRHLFTGSWNRLNYLACRIAAIPPVGKILNIGVGDGTFERIAIDRAMDVYSLDPGQESIEALPAKGSAGVSSNAPPGSPAESAYAKVGTAQDIPWPAGTFSHVLTSEVLEHMTREDAVKGLRDIFRVLQGGGMLIGSVPAREQLVQQEVHCPHCSETFHRWGHLQSFTAESMRELLRECGFDVTLCVERPFIPWRILNWKGRLQGASKMAVWYLGVHGTNEHVHFEARTQLQPG